MLFLEFQCNRTQTQKVGYSFVLPPHLFFFLKVCKILYSRLGLHLCCLEEAGENKPHREWRTNPTMQLCGKKTLPILGVKGNVTVTWLRV